MSPQLEQLARVVADTVGIDGITFDADDSISLEFDGTMVTLAVIGERLILNSALAHLSGFPDTASLFRVVLAADDDRLDLAGGNCCFAIDNTANSIELCATLMPLAAVDQDILAGALARFHELNRYWILKLGEMSLPQQDSGTEAQAPGSLV